MKKIILIAFTFSLLCSCTNTATKTGSDASQNSIVITNDMEDAAVIIPSWINEKTVVELKEPKAHSGKYACVTDETHDFGYGYSEQIKNIIPGLPKVIFVSAWAYTTIANPNIAIIMDISENDKNYDWKAFPLADSLTEPGKWVEFNTAFYFDKPLNPDQFIRIYPWNQSKKAVYIDDLKITFYY